MKIFLVLFFSAVGSISYAGKTAKIHYFENYPNNKQKLIFKIDKACKSDPHSLQIKEFYSEKKYTSVDSGKKKPVRIVHVHVNSSLDHCKDVIASNVEKEFEIPQSKMMTHVYIISHPSIGVNSLQ